MDGEEVRCMWYHTVFPLSVTICVVHLVCMQVLDQPLTLFARGEVAPIPTIIVSGRAFLVTLHMLCVCPEHLPFNLANLLGNPII